MGRLIESRKLLEDKILSAVLSSRDPNTKVKEKNLDERHFLNIDNREIFKKIVELGDQCNLATLSARLETKQFLLVNELTSLESFDQEITPCIAEIERIEKIEKIKALSDNLENINVDQITSLLKDLEEKIPNERQTEMGRDIASRLYTKYEKASENPGKLTGVTSGLSSLDRFTAGFQPGNVYMIAARPSMGKSAFCMNIARGALESGKKVYVQALEECSDSFVSRMIASMSQLNNENLNKGFVTATDFEKILDSINKISRFNLAINDSTNLNSNTITKLFKRENERGRVDLFILDHIQEVSETSQSRREEVSKAASTIRGIAKAYNIPVIIVSQLSRSVEARADKTPMMSDLKESGDLEAQADVIMMLYREYYYNKEARPDQMTVIIAKARNSRTGRINVRFDLNTLTIDDLLV